MNPSPLHQAALLASLLVSAPGRAQSLDIVYDFQGDPASVTPNGGVVGHAGIFYGTTSAGGSGQGTVVSVDPAAHSEKVIYSFGGSDGASPSGNLIYAAHALYGTTATGGGGYNDGVVFKVDPSTGAETILHIFTGPDGSGPTNLLIVGKYLYGITNLGGNAYGTVYKIDLGTLSQTVLYRFTGFSDGGFPTGLSYASGFLYGTAFDGPKGNGYIYKIDVKSGAKLDLYDFLGGADGSVPSEVSIKSGTLYGITTLGGTANHGTAFKIDLAQAKKTTLYSFQGQADGCTPYNAPTVVGGGLFGATSGCGTNGTGALYRIDADKKTEVTLYDFPSGTNGNPSGALYLSGTAFYGILPGGGAYADGALYAFAP